jgi:hypothetical protein
MFTLHALLVNTAILVVYGLLVAESAADYNQFFEKILDQDTFEPMSIMTDFEQATIKSVKEKFPNVLQKGKACGYLIFSHLSVSLSRLSLSLRASCLAEYSKQPLIKEIQ